jgi:hypothetical protein
MNLIPWHLVLDISAWVLLAAGGCWGGWHFLRKSLNPAKLVFKWVLTAACIELNIWLIHHCQSFILPILILPGAITIGLMWAPGVGSKMAGMLTNSMDGGDVPPEDQPFYSVAETKRLNGHPQEAVAAVRGQLEKYPGDFHGTMLLASILAEDLNDLPGAQLALERWIAGPSATPHGMASALTTMADWHLQFAQDPVAARETLERIVKALPDTPLAHRAAQRLAHLPTMEHLVSARTAAPMTLCPGEKHVGLLKDYAGPAPAAPDPDALAEEFVQQLEKHPADTSTREKLAVLYADHFHRLDLAVDQLEQLIAFPNETPRHIARWLNLLADLQIRRGRDLAAAEAALRRIIERFPTPALAEPAAARLASLRAEMNGGRPTQVKTMGRYEKNLGLKQTKG